MVKNEKYPFITEDKIYFKDAVEYFLNNNPGEFYTRAVIDFYAKMPANARSYLRKNSVYSFMMYLNAYMEEQAFIKLNFDKLSFIEDNHDSLNLKRGNNVPDFKTIGDIEGHTLEIKMHYCVKTFNDCITDKKLENAEYAVSYIINEKQFYYCRKINGVYTAAEPVNTADRQQLGILANLVFPTEVNRIVFKTPWFPSLAEINKEELLPSFVTFTVEHTMVD